MKTGKHLIPISHRCTELEEKEWKEVFPHLSMLNLKCKQRLALTDRGKLFFISHPVNRTGVKWVLLRQGKNFTTALLGCHKIPDKRSPAQVTTGICTSETVGSS